MARPAFINSGTRYGATNSAPRTRRPGRPAAAAGASYTRARAHKYAPRERASAALARTTAVPRIIICIPTSCCEKRTIGARPSSLPCLSQARASSPRLRPRGFGFALGFGFCCEKVPRCVWKLFKAGPPIVQIDFDRYANGTFSIYTSNAFEYILL